MRIVDPLRKLRVIVEEHGSQKAAASKLNICQTTLSAILLGRRDVPKTLAEKMGLEKKLVYVEKRA